MVYVYLKSGQNPHTQVGAALLEVMIAGVLFMIGMLGLLATQGLSLKLASTSSTYTNASFLAIDIADRMQSNYAAALAGNYLVSITPATNLTAAVDCGDADIVCTQTQLASYDLAQWQNQIRNQLPRNSANASITRTAVGSSLFEIELVWLAQIDTDDDGDGSEDNTATNCANGADRPANERAYCVIIETASLRALES